MIMGSETTELLTKTLVPVPGSIGLYQEQRKFSNLSLQASIDSAIASMGSAEKGFEAIFQADAATGINTAVVIKLSGVWSVAAAFHAKDRSDMAVGFAISGRW
jgi:hypothetical protein